jgi:hypothetical protein
MSSEHTPAVANAHLLGERVGHYFVVKSLIHGHLVPPPGAGVGRGPLALSGHHLGQGPATKSAIAQEPPRAR